jgi:signal transduction histidine kinase
LTVINDVLDFSKIEAGRLDLAPRPFELRAELEGVAALHRPLATERGVTLELDLPAELPRRVVADPTGYRSWGTCSATPSSSPTRAASP